MHKILVWGIGSCCEDFEESINDLNVEIIAYVASNKSGCDYRNDKPVICPKEISSYCFDYIYVASQFYDEIISTVRNLDNADALYGKIIPAYSVMKDFKIVKYDKNKAREGYCPVCKSNTLFVDTVWKSPDKSFYWEYQECAKCKQLQAQRSLFNALDTFLPEWENMSIHESSPGAVTCGVLKKRAKNYSYSHYFSDAKCGQYVDNPDILKEYGEAVRCENLENMTFPDSSFDLFLTFEVLEHVFKPEKALGEICRVLKPGGHFVFTVPWSTDPNIKTKRLAELLDDGSINYLEPPSYHCNPIDEKGSLVTYRYGHDFPEFIFKHSKMTAMAYSYFSERIGIMPAEVGSSPVVICRKSD